MGTMMDDDDADLGRGSISYRQSVTPAGIRALSLINKRDRRVRDVVSSVQAPTLVVHGERDHAFRSPRAGAGPPTTSRERASSNCPGPAHPPVGEDAEREPVSEIKPSLEKAPGESDPGDGELRPSARHCPLHRHRRVELERAVELGDRAWRELPERHHELVRRQLASATAGAKWTPPETASSPASTGPREESCCACAILERASKQAIDQVDEPARVAPLVVVPADHLRPGSRAPSSRAPSMMQRVRRCRRCRTRRSGPRCTGGSLPSGRRRRPIGTRRSRLAARRLAAEHADEVGDRSRRDRDAHRHPVEPCPSARGSPRRSPSRRPVEAGMMLCGAARMRRRSALPLRVMDLIRSCCSVRVRVDRRHEARARSRTLSCRTFAIGATQFVVQDAFEMM